MNSKRILAGLICMVMALGMLGVAAPVGAVTVVDVPSTVGTEFAPDWPCNTYYISTLDKYSGGSAHTGIDIYTVNSDQVNIVAVADGVVTARYNGCNSVDAGDGHDCGCGRRGNYVTLKHEVGGVTYYSRYCHLVKDSLKVSVGNTVSKGKVLGVMGSSGESTARHLHLTIARNFTAGEMSHTFDYYLINTTIAKKLRILTSALVTDGRYNDWVKTFYKKSGNKYIWRGAENPTATFYNNYSGKNYVLGSDFTTLKSTVSTYPATSDSYYTLAIDDTQQADGYNSLKITGRAAGSTSNRVNFSTSTNEDRLNKYAAGDNRSFTLSFYAKASVSGAEMTWWWYAQKANMPVVKLSTQWQKFVIPMNKAVSYRAQLRTFVNKKCTVWLSQVQLEDGTAATQFIPETGGVSSTQTCTGALGTLPIPTAREGHVFTGWYTKANCAGSPVEAATAINFHRRLYAGWEQTPPTNVPELRGTVLDGGNVTLSWTAREGAGPFVACLMAEGETIETAVLRHDTDAMEHTFKDVAPGRYTAQVLALNGDGPSGTETLIVAEDYAPLYAAVNLDSLFVAYDSPLSWLNADLLAQDMGGHLATFARDPEGGDFFTAPLDGSIIYFPLKQGAAETYHIGARRDADDAGWNWITDENWEYEHWEGGAAPSAPGRAGATTEGYWVASDGAFGDKTGFIVEYELAEASAVAAADGRRYELFSQPMTWSAAQARCESMGGTLACAGNAEELALLASLAAEAGDAGAWLGASGENGAFTWLDGGAISAESGSGSRLYISPEGALSASLDRQPRQFICELPPALEAAAHTRDGGQVIEVSQVMDEGRELVVKLYAGAELLRARRIPVSLETTTISVALIDDDGQADRALLYYAEPGEDTPLYGLAVSLTLAPFNKSLLYGDVNGDGALDVADSTELMVHYHVPTLKGDALLRADVDGNGTVDLNDYDELTLHLDLDDYALPIMRRLSAGPGFAWNEIDLAGPPAGIVSVELSEDSALVTAVCDLPQTLPCVCLLAVYDEQGKMTGLSMARGEISGPAGASWNLPYAPGAVISAFILSPEGVPLALDATLTRE